MNAQPLYDLSPVLHIMLMGVVVALGPLSWMWLRNPRAVPARRLQALTLAVMFLTFDLVLFGAFTRLTDSGLGCPDWPGCYGNASPSGAQVQIDEAQAEMPTDVGQGVAVVHTDHGKTANDAAVFADGELAGGDVGKFRLLLAFRVRREAYGRLREAYYRRKFKNVYSCRLKLATAEQADGQQNESQGYSRMWQASRCFFQ